MTIMVPGVWCLVNQTLSLSFVTACLSKVPLSAAINLSTFSFKVVPAKKSDFPPKMM